jgi:quercetin dioxygenase-like cupin family protein
MSINQFTTAPRIVAPRIVAPGGGETLEGYGVTMTYKVAGEQSNGQWLVLEYAAPPRSVGPAPHWHKVTTEHFYVLEGTLSVDVDGQVSALGVGGYAFVPPGCVHTFSNATDAPVKFLLTTSPAGLEAYFAEMGELLANEPEWPPKDMSKVVALMAKYDSFAPPVA